GLYITGTSYSMSSDQLYKAYVFLHNSLYGAGRGHYKDFNLQGRSISRVGNNGGLSATLAAEAMKVDSGHAATLRNDSLRASGVQPAGYNVATPYHIHYRTGDYTLHNRPAYAFSVLGVSTRTYRSESINGENLYGKFLNEGATAIRVSGNEYYNIFPVWDWNKVPGITMREFATPQQNSSSLYGSTAFVGGVSDSSYGASVYQQNYVGVTARKAWFFFDNEVVCLGAGITSTQTENIATSVNQCLLNGTAVSVKSSGTISTLTAQTQAGYNNNLQWVLHNKIGYFFPAGGNITVSNKTQTGNWYSINSTQANASVSMDVFNMSISHGVQPTNAGYAYIIVPGITSTAGMDAYDTTAIKIISNTSAVQAVKHSGLKMLQIIFHTAGTLVDSSAHLKITVSNPCALLIKNTDSSRIAVSIADPTQLLTGITLTVNFSYTGISHSTNITLPAGNTKGASATVVVDSTILPTPAGNLYPAIEDAYVRDGATYAGINYGTVTGLPVKNDGVGYTRQIYFKFDPRLQARPVNKAKLRLYCTGGNTSANTTQWALYKTTSGSWTEGGITWNNKPASLNQVAIHDGQVAAGYVEWDVTTALNSLPADSLLSFQLVSTLTGATTDATFSSREATDSARRPVMTIDNTPPAKDSVLTIADAYVRDGATYSSSNFGTATGLVVKNDPAAGYSRETYLKFNLNTVKPHVVKATLRLYGSGNTTANTMLWKLYAVNDDTWTETGITWNNKPAAGALTDSITGKAGAAYSEWDISSLVQNLQGDSLVSFKIIATGTGGGTTDVTFYSKETSTPAWRPVVVLYNDTTADAGSRAADKGPKVQPADSLA
ncbi:MAG TPA: polysaccharide lyase family 8 super-sandwich domain-containing protein, partial [Chitinophagaceae bacterium]|nr:polysaccharide lyase family 8 super-sandwich domain-containing protein [Chitinophagaceae bacterium]